MGAFSASKNPKVTKSVKKILKIGKKFSAFFTPPGSAHPTPRSRLRGDVSKIASMSLNNYARDAYMPNFSPIPCSVWAVGGGGSKNVRHILYLEETCSEVELFPKALDAIVGISY